MGQIYNPGVNVDSLYAQQSAMAPSFDGRNPSQNNPIDLMILAELARMGGPRPNGNPTGDGAGPSMSPFEGATNANNAQPGGAGGGGSVGTGSFGVGNIGLGGAWSPYNLSPQLNEIQHQSQLGNFLSRWGVSGAAALAGAPFSGQIGRLSQMAYQHGRIPPKIDPATGRFVYPNDPLWDQLGNTQSGGEMVGPPDPGAPQTGAIRDQASRATDNTAYSGLWGPGSGSRMNRNSAFIYGMGLPGQNNAQYEPQWRTRLSGDK